MRKAEIEMRAISGLPLDGIDVCTTHGKSGSIILRHIWHDNIDARIWAGIRSAFMSLACDLANFKQIPIDVYTRDGIMLEQVQPDG